MLPDSIPDAPALRSPKHTAIADDGFSDSPTRSPRAGHSGSGSAARANPWAAGKPTGSAAQAAFASAAPGWGASARQPAADYSAKLKPGAVQAERTTQLTADTAKLAKVHEATFGLRPSAMISAARFTHRLIDHWRIESVCLNAVAHPGTRRVERG